MTIGSEYIRMPATRPLTTTGAMLEAKFLAAIQKFLRERKTGKITLNVKDGNVLVVDIQESLRL